MRRLVSGRRQEEGIAHDDDHMNMTIDRDGHYSTLAAARWS
ncbi:MAG: hypothetical protein ABJA20_13340 [Novosphingobium sp.]